jgi:hypothetical protein
MKLFSFLVFILISISVVKSIKNNDDDYYIKLICSHNKNYYWLIEFKNETKIKFNTPSIIDFYKNFTINIYKENNFSVFRMSKSVNIENNEYLKISYVYEIKNEPNCNCFHVCDYLLKYENKSMFFFL